MRINLTYLFIVPALALLVSAPVRANLLVDGDFSTSPGSGSGGTITSLDAGNSYQYDLQTGSGGAITTSAVGGTNGWTFTDQNNNHQGSGSQNGAAIYVVDTQYSGFAETWVPQAASSNTSGYVVQLDSTDTGGLNWRVGNGISQTVTVTSGKSYYLTFSINTESGTSKAGTSGADVMVTNATITNSTGSTSTIAPSSTGTNRNAFYYGNVTGYQYEVTTTGVGGTASTWATYTMTFTATSSSVGISFADDPTSDNSNISLESISLVAVPEPRQWALIVLLGMAVFVVVGKFRNRSSFAA